MRGWAVEVAEGTTEGERAGKVRLLTQSDQDGLYLTPTNLTVLFFFAVVDTHILISRCLFCLAFSY